MNDILIGKTAHGSDVTIPLAMLNRHGLIAGATGTGKTVSLQVLAEQFSKAGIPVFAADIKGDLSGIAQAGQPGEKILERVSLLGLTEYAPSRSPVAFWDVFGSSGLNLRTTISEMGPVLLSVLLDCTEAQAGVLHIAFRVADEQGMLLLDLKDLRALLTWMDENRKEVSATYGRISTSSIGAIQRELLVLDEAGGDVFFGEPALTIADLMHKDFSGRGVVSLLDSTTLIQNPRIYATFLLWLLSELFEDLPEKGDREKPELVFFFDEAHVLFNAAPKFLQEKIEQIVRLIRSRGVGVFFVTQHPEDIPDAVAAQLGTRILHGLRAFTPNEQASLKVAARSFRANPDLDAVAVLPNLKVGEALVSTLDENGAPTVVERTLIRPPESQIGPAEETLRKQLCKDSPLSSRYSQAIDRSSAYEVLKERKEKAIAEAPKEVKKTSSRQTPTEAFYKSVLRSIGNALGRQIARGILGGITRR